MSSKTKAIAKKNPGWARISTFEKTMIIGIPLVIATALGIHRVRTGRWWKSA